MAAASPTARSPSGAFDSVRKKLEAVHAAEIGQLRKQIKELEDARAGLLRPTEHITRPLRQALASEAATGHLTTVMSSTQYTHDTDAEGR